MSKFDVFCTYCIKQTLQFLSSLIQLKYRRGIVCKIQDPIFQIVWINNDSKVDIPRITSEVYLVHFKPSIIIYYRAYDKINDDMHSAFSRGFRDKVFPISSFLSLASIGKS